MKKMLSVGLVALFASFSTVAMAAGDPTAGKAKSATCVACHGADGNSSIALNPKLAGQHAAYIAKQISDFQSGGRTDAVMMSMVNALTAQDIEDVAAYFAEQKAADTIASEENLALGESIYRGGITAAGIAACTACHGPAGNGNPAAGYPSLSGQHAAYTAKTAKRFSPGHALERSCWCHANTGKAYDRRRDRSRQ